MRHIVFMGSTMTQLNRICTKSKELNSGMGTGVQRQKREIKKVILENQAGLNIRSFEGLLLEAIDEGLSILGESSKQSVYFYLEEKFNLNRLDIPCRIEEFNDAIEQIFGLGGKRLEIQIMQCLFVKVGFPVKSYPDEKSLAFVEYVRAVELEKKRREGKIFQ